MGNLHLASVRKFYGTHEVLKGVDLKVDDGEFVVFVGPSGCGKSTLLRAIAGLEDISQGSILIDNADVSHAPPAKRGIAMVFQSYALYPHLSVRDNMGLGLKQAGTPKAEIDQRVSHASSMLSLEPYLARRPTELSGGQRQRVAIGRAVVREPKLFLFDEPLSNLDAALRVQTRLEIAKLHRRLKATMIYVTHDQVEAMTLADRIVVLSAGKIEQVGSPMELYNKPANLFVAGFIGSPQMNFIEAGRIGMQGLKTLGIRPEHVTLSRVEGAWPAIIVYVEHLGADTIVYLESETLGHVTARLFGEHAYAPNERVFVSFPESHAHRFDNDGNAIRR
ncbi:ATP-binding cassette domain-containing protein [Rhizobium bangladeshense]|uniref:ATP-binding cassette domain-containing protein n=1 Tax=Rhizobium bangladeshense TaxID=1138189 RepID=A0ABS7LLH6_9HYPH|nr:ATP-binding cassette domain-containing protein [Rhizobium bangladeshense]MBY3592334.1 ATP-binding cassette domain-containing protein [Rhizobium bangladeshense]